MTGRIFDIEHASFVDGPGIRTTVFFKGCNLRCAWCHNPESRSFAVERLYYADRCVGCGRCRAVCPSPEKCVLCGKCADVCEKGAIRMVGRDAEEGEILSEILADRDYYGEDGGVTFSGGECMLQVDFLASLLTACKKEKIRTAVDTAGDVPLSSFEKILPVTDLFLYDIKGMDPDAHLKNTGADPTRIRENYARLISLGAHVWVRYPLVPGANDSDGEIDALEAFFREHGFSEKVEFLPYHRMGENKYAAMGLPASTYGVPSADRVAELNRRFNR